MKNQSERTECTHESGRHFVIRAVMLAAAIAVLTIASSHLRADTGPCGAQTINLPFTDVTGSPFFCQIAEAYFSGLTNGTDATHYSPGSNVTRDQMAAFITRTQDSALRRGSRRAALGQWGQGTFSTGGMTDVGPPGALDVRSDGADLWVTNPGDGTVSRVRASDGKLLETWTIAAAAFGLVVSRGRIFIAGGGNPGRLYRIDPKQPAGVVTTVTNQLGESPSGITTDESFIWTANNGGSVSKVNPGTGDVNTFSAGFISPAGILYDGSNIWVTDSGANALKKLDSSGNILQTIPVGLNPLYLTFDGTNIWVTNFDSASITVVRIKDSQGNPLASAFVLATLTGNGLNRPFAAAFDGERILVANRDGDSVSLWRAADLIPIGSFSSGANSAPTGACSDGVNFWVVFQGTGKLARF